MATEDVKVNSETFMNDLVQRIRTLEAGQKELETGQKEIIKKTYEFDKELSGVQIDLKYIREGLDHTRGGINKLLWGIALVFVTYVVGFVVNGGLTIGGG